MEDCIPVNLRVGLLFPEYAGMERPITLGIQIVEPHGDYQLFADSFAIKRELRSIIQRSWRVSLDDPPEFVHPNVLEVAATIATIIYCERADCVYPDLWITPRILQDDNWQTLYRAFIQLFRNGEGFIAKWRSMLEKRQHAPRILIGDLIEDPLEDGSGEIYRTPSGEVLLQDRHFIVEFKTTTGPEVE